MRCGAEHDNPIGKFYKSTWSELYIKNDRYVPLCKNCVNEIFDTISRKYRSDKIACIMLCHCMDIPFYNILFDSIITNNSNFSMGMYCRQLNNKQYQMKTFQQSILDGEVNKTEEKIQEEREVRWNKDEINNKEEAVKLIGYDPFEGYSDTDRRFLFNELIKYFDDDTADDTYKLSQIIQIVNNNNQIRNIDLTITNMSSGAEALTKGNDIKNLSEIKGKLVTSNDKIAKENEISVKNRSNKEVGKSTLTHLQRKLRELNFEKAEADYYNQLTSSGTQWAIDMSNKSIRENGMFDENDKQEIFIINREKLIETTKKLNEEIEKNRRLQEEIDKLKSPPLIEDGDD